MKSFQINHARPREGYSMKVWVELIAASCGEFDP